jgi:pimeloyl-ACP methyl ester carboxylesterase
VEIPLAFRNKGKQLISILHLPPGRNAPCVIMQHGWGGNKLGPYRLFVFAAREFSRRGFAVLRIDPRGSGDSEGLFEHQTLKSQIEDLSASISYLQSNYSDDIDCEKIGLIGHSQGGKVIVLCASRDNRVKCIDSWAGASKIRDFYSEMDIRELLEKGYVDYPDYGVKAIKKSVLQDFGAEYDPVPALKKLRIPVQITTGTHDTIVRVSTAKMLYRNANKPKKLNLINGADHWFYTENHKRQLIQSSISWFKRWL